MIERDGARIRVRAPMIIANARTLLVEMQPVLATDGGAVIDLSEVTEFDSSALAVMMQWQRTAGPAGVRFASLPAHLSTLAQLYGVAELFPVAVQPA